MSPPPLVTYQTEDEYRRHYKRTYCMNQVHTHDGIRVYFEDDRFNHAFYRPVNRQGRKEVFDPARAERIDWIKATLEHPNSRLYQGWNKAIKVYEPNRRVSVVYESFVVVIELRLKQDGTLKANFITCYVADNSLRKIQQSPEWSLEECMNTLTKNGR